MLCRACCREKTFTEHLNCRSHRFKCDGKTESSTKDDEVKVNKDTENENRTEPCNASEPIK